MTRNEILKRRNYNCGGYALGTKTWYLPYDKSTRGTRVYSIIKSFNGDFNLALNYMVKHILNEFKNLKLVSKDELPKNERVIAFRLARNDFHFLKRGKNNVWYGKMGSSPKIDKIEKELALNEDKTWNNGRNIYEGKIAYFIEE